MQTLLSGLTSGALIALLGLSFQLVYLPTRVFFVALAGIYSLAPFLASALHRGGLGWAVALIAASIACAAIALGLEWASHRRLARHRASEGAHLIASLGAYTVIAQVIAMVWGNETKPLRMTLDSVTDLFGMRITGAQWWTLGAAVVVICSLSALLRLSPAGLRLRALAENPAQLALFGYNIHRHRALAFVLAGLIASVSALATAYDTGFDPHGGLHALILAIVAVIVGGRDTFAGPVVGGLMVGLLRAQVVWHSSARWEEPATFAVLVAFLMFRPWGVLGRKARIEATTQ